jgi:8-oxo-dGTP diphosphatase
MKKVLGAVWRKLPKRARRAWVLLTQERFTVAAAAVLEDEHGRVLLLEHTFRPGSGWGIPGGFINRCEQPEEAIRRELREEVGIDAARLELAFVRTLASVNQVEVVFCGSPEGEAKPRSLEIRRAAWFGFDALPAGLGADQVAVIMRALGRTTDIR